MFEYRNVFPENLRAARVTTKAQTWKVIEEASEINRAIRDEESRERVMEETLDTLHAIEGILRRFSPAEIDEGIKKVYLKNKSRGDYL